VAVTLAISLPKGALASAIVANLLTTFGKYCGFWCKYVREAQQGPKRVTDYAAGSAFCAITRHPNTSTT